MLQIFANKQYKDRLLPFIQKEKGLDELLVWKSIDEFCPGDSPALQVSPEKVVLEHDWWDYGPPLNFPTLSSEEPEPILALIYQALGNEQRALEILSASHDLYPYIELSYALKFGLQMPAQVLDQIREPQSQNAQLLHNQAVVAHYANLVPAFSPQEVKSFYEAALNSAPDTLSQCFTLKHYLSFLIDHQETALAEEKLNEALTQKLPEMGEYSLKQLLANIGLQKLAIPYDRNEVQRLLHLVKDGLQFCVEQGQELNEAYLLMDASRLSNISGNYSEALGCIQRAIQVFEKEQIPSLVGDAYLQKANLLNSWAQNSNEQFFMAALEAYLKALTYFPKEERPEMYAEIQHYLGLIYSKLKGDKSQNTIWAAKSAQAFKEALDYYTKTSAPYEYGMICNNFANALIHYPTAAQTDNFANALKYYREALEIRGKELPYERALTLLNFIEANWYLMADEEDNKFRLKDMMEKAQEVKSLVEDPELFKEADKHLLALENLKEKI